ncbi:MAG TPA: GatB/YqeY domain-containing protein [Candidatus Paceibacterota bacterium]
MSLQLDMKEQMKAAMRAKDAVRLSVVRGVIAAFTNEAVTLGKGPAGELSDDEALAVIRREAKKRKDSIEQFKSGGRPELAESEQAELNVLSEFLPAMMDEAQVKKVVEAKKSELGITDKSRQGELMKVVMSELKGKADGGTVKQVVESLLS